ncbi:hypothetical protein MZH06_04715 [Escherichia coli]|nr:hypothetical protein [Escherichia coli]
MNNSINTPRLTSALQLIEQAAAVLVAVSLSAEEMDAADVVDAIKACSSLVIGVYAHRTRYDDVLCRYTNHMYLV